MSPDPGTLQSSHDNPCDDGLGTMTTTLTFPQV